MRNKKPLRSFPVALIFCSIVGHKYRVTNKITDHIKEYKCCNCGEEVTNTANGILEKLTPKFKETNAFIAKVHEKKIRKKNKKRTFSEAS